MLNWTNKELNVFVIYSQRFGIFELATLFEFARSNIHCGVFSKKLYMASTAAGKKGPSNEEKYCGIVRQNNLCRISIFHGNCEWDILFFK